MSRLLARLRGRSSLRLLCAVAAATAVVWCWSWALMPIEAPELTTPKFTPATASERKGELAILDASAFSAPLWVAPPALPIETPEAVPPPLPPFRLQLLAVVRGQGPPLALFYDPDQDRLLSVVEGQKISEAAVLETVTGAAVTIREGERLRRLALREGAEGGKP